MVVVAIGALEADDAETAPPRSVAPDGGDSYKSPHLATLEGSPQVLLFTAGRVTSIALAGGRWPVAEARVVLGRKAMIPKHITAEHIEEAIRLIIRDGMPPGRKSRGYCLTTKGAHLPPKYTIALAHQIATGELLPSDRFSGGPESNEFLRCRGFAVTECDCRGSVRDGPGAAVPPPSGRRARTRRPKSHSERCPACKIRVGQLLKRIYGACVRNHRFRWQTGLAAYAGTSIEPVLRDVTGALEGYRGYGVGTFARTQMLAACDYWVPDPGLIVEFDESQHFTSPRKLALAAYADAHPLGFPARRWLDLCEQHDARDNDPAFRDEQRAWYDTLRDLVPLIKGLQPTVRLYARDQAWCSLDPESNEDRKRFSDMIHEGESRSRRATAIRRSTARPESSLRAALVLPQIAERASNGVPPSGPGAQQPDVPTADSLAGEAIDFVLFPEGYVSASDQGRAESLRKLAADLNAPLLVGAVDTTADATHRAWQVLLRFDPDGSSSRVYTKHSTANAVAFERSDWEPNSALPTFEIAGVTAGATICHDQYLGLLPRALAARGARLWVNPSFDNVIDIKWSSILRLRAVEHRFFSLCTLHYDVSRNRTHPFGLSPDGAELWAREPGSDRARPLSECCDAGSIYVVDLDMTMVGAPLDWSKIPPAPRPRKPRKGKPRKPVSVILRDGRPSVLGGLGGSRRDTTDSHFRIESVHGSVYVGVVPNDRILDAAACFHVLDHAKQMNCTPIIWNHWDRLPADSTRLANLMMGRVIECCTPVVISDADGIHELVELANGFKIPTRRVVEASGEAIVDLKYAWGLDNAFNIVTKHLPRGMARPALDRYRGLG